MSDWQNEVDAVIAYIHQHLDEELPLSRLARYVGYSPYHFTRMFKARTGLPPLYYVSSVRLQRAKDLLLNTNWSVRDIAMEIGQQSLGTFTTRFTERVGVTPAHFRHSAEQADYLLHSLKRLPEWPGTPRISPDGGRVEGTVSAVVPVEGVILIGLFPKPIPEGLPLYGTLLSGVGDFCFSGVKPGTYWLMATSVSWGMRAVEVLLPETTLRYRSKQPIVVTPHTPVPQQHVMLQLPQPDDPPILISLPVLMNNFYNRVMPHNNG